MQTVNRVFPGTFDARLYLLVSMTRDGYSSFSRSLSDMILPSAPPSARAVLGKDVGADGGVALTAEGGRELSVCDGLPIPYALAGRRGGDTGFWIASSCNEARVSTFIACGTNLTERTLTWRACCEACKDSSLDRI